MPVLSRRVAYVTQHNCLFEHLTVEQNLDYVISRREKRGLSKGNEVLALNDITEQFNIAHLLKNYPQQLSGGETQLVEISRALLSNPQLLLFDEPFSALDEGTRELLLAQLESIKSIIEAPIIFVTHRMEELTRLADYGVLIEKGEVIAQDSITKLLTNPNLPLASDQQACSVLEASVIQTNCQRGIATVKTVGGCELRLATNNTLDAGKPLRIQIYAKDVSIALTQASDSSCLLYTSDAADES